MQSDQGVAVNATTLSRRDGFSRSRLQDDEDLFAHEDDYTDVADEATAESGVQTSHMIESAVIVGPEMTDAAVELDHDLHL